MTCLWIELSDLAQIQLHARAHRRFHLTSPHAGGLRCGCEIFGTFLGVRDPAPVRGENWASAARHFVLKEYDKSDIRIVIVYLILALHDFGKGQTWTSWMFSVIAHRIAYDLKLNKD